MRTMATAGRAVVFSGTAVAIGLALLLFMPLPFMRGFGVGGLIIPAVSVLAAVTLLPALLSLVGERLDRVRLLPKRCSSGARATSAASGRRSRATIMRRPVLFAVGASRDPDRARVAGTRAPARPGLEHGHPAAARGGAGARPAHARRSGRARRRRRTSSSTPAEAGGAADAGDHAPPWRGSRAGLRGRSRRSHGVRFDPRSPQHVDASGRYLNVEVVGKQRLRQAGESRRSSTRLRDDLVPAAGFPPHGRGLRGRRPARRQGLPRPHLQLVPVARARRAASRPTSCCCARSARCSCR